MAQYINDTNFAGLSKFIVSPTPGYGSYTTVQSAINAANTAGGGTVYINPGTYTENLTIPGGISLVGSLGAQQNSVTITGVHTITNWTGIISAQNIVFQTSSGTLFTVSSNTSNSTSITFTNCYLHATATGATMSATSTSTANFTINVNSGYTISGATAFTCSGVMTLSIGGGLVEAVTGSCFNTTGGVTIYAIYCNLKADGGGVCSVGGTADVYNIVNCFGSSLTEIVLFTNNGTVSIGNVSFICSTASNNWVTGVGTVIFGNVGIVGTAQNISSATIAVPEFGKPVYLYRHLNNFNATMSVFNGYYITTGARVLALPTTSSAGDVVAVTLAGGTSWQITQAAGQSIIVGGQTTTAGTGGSITSSSNGDSITLECITANVLWVATSMIGNLLIV